jgi:hypothetical protein
MMNLAPTLPFLLIASLHPLLAADLAHQSLDLIDPGLFGFGMPGAKTEFTFSAAQDFTAGDGALSLLDGRVRLPVWGRELEEGTMLGASISYGWSALELELDGVPGIGLGPQFLQEVELQLGIVHFPTAAQGDEGWMGIGIVSPGMGGRAFAFTAIGLAGYQYSKRFTLAVAGIYRYSLGETLALPGVGFLWQPTPQWLVQATAPVFAIGWKPAPELTYSLCAYPAGGRWGVDHQGTDGKIAGITLESWRAGCGVEYTWRDHWRLTAQVGLNLAGKLELRQAGERVILGRDLESSAFGLLGVAWTF